MPRETVSRESVAGEGWKLVAPHKRRKALTPPEVGKRA